VGRIAEQAAVGRVGVGAPAVEIEDGDQLGNVLGDLAEALLVFTELLLSPAPALPFLQQGDRLTNRGE